MSRSFTFLGTGTSTGVPLLGCDCETCRSPDPRNQRCRCAVVISLPQGHILVDTPPEIRLQLLRAGVHRVEAVLYTHHHADHIFGFDDVRHFARQLGGPVPIYCSEATERFLHRTFDYAFPADETLWQQGRVPHVALHRIGSEPFEVLGQRVIPIPLEHSIPVTGFRFDRLAYCPDVGAIPPHSWQLLQGVEILVLNALRPRKPLSGHLTLEQALEIVARLKPRQAYLTHLGHEIEHNRISEQLPAGVELAYDGLSFSF